MIQRTEGFIPPYQDIETLAEHLSVSVRTIERMVKARELPAPIERGGKRLWRWSGVPG
jgi:excisionase family DNA binding protein